MQLDLPKNFNLFLWLVALHSTVPSQAPPLEVEKLLTSWDKDLPTSEYTKGSMTLDQS